MDEKQFMQVAKALADSRRFDILRAISETNEMSCGAIAEQFPIGQSTVSHHLRLLLDAGIVTVRREGQHGFFSAKPAVLEEYISELQKRVIAPRSQAHPDFS
ncbi:MAG: ArsR/SmtB family transcription factor [Thermodesulfobacteriota bacterium]